MAAYSKSRPKTDVSGDSLLERRDNYTAVRSVRFTFLAVKVGSYDDFFRTLWYYMLYQRVWVAYGSEFHYLC
jgi:hypothetical protein